MASIQERVIGVLVEITGRKKQEISLTSTLEEIGVSFICKTDLIPMIEAEFGVAVEDDVIYNATLVSHIIHYMEGDLDPTPETA